MVDVEDRMTTKGEVLHTLVSFGALQRTEEHEAKAENTEDGKDQDNQMRVGKETCRNRRVNLISTIACCTQREITRQRHGSFRKPYRHHRINYQWIVELPSTRHARKIERKERKTTKKMLSRRLVSKEQINKWVRHAVGFFERSVVGYAHRKDGNC